MIRIPATRNNEIKRVQQLYNEMTAGFGREPTFKEMADKIGFTVGRIEEDFQLVNRYVGLYPKEDMDKLSEETRAGWTQAMLPWDTLVEKITMEEINGHMAVLDSNERVALEMRFGLDGKKEHSYREIEEALNLRSASGWKFTQKALKKIKKEIKTEAWA